MNLVEMVKFSIYQDRTSRDALPAITHDICQGFARDTVKR